MSYTADDLAALKVAYASGTLEVRFADGRQVKYATGDDLKRRISEVETALAVQASGRRRGPAVLTSFTRG